MASLSLSLDAFHTYVVAAEFMVNSRPLMPVPTDRRDLEALSPLSFLCPGVLAISAAEILPPTYGRKIPSLSQSYLAIRALADGFWHRWTTEYVAQLQGRRKWSSRQRNLRVNDVVLVVDGQTPRDQWPLGLILETVQGPDGCVRRVYVRTATSPRLDRHVTGVVLLEGVEDEEALAGEAAGPEVAGGNAASGEGDVPDLGADPAGDMGGEGIIEGGGAESCFPLLNPSPRPSTASISPELTPPSTLSPLAVEFCLSSESRSPPQNVNKPADLVAGHLASPSTLGIRVQPSRSARMTGKYSK